MEKTEVKEFIGNRFVEDCTGCRGQGWITDPWERGEVPANRRCTRCDGSGQVPTIEGSDLLEFLRAYGH